MGNGNILSDILGSYAAKRARAEALAARRALDAERGAPAYAEACKAERDAILRYGKAVLEAPDRADELKASFEAERAALANRREAALKAAGIDPASLLPKYECAYCRDTGYCGDPVKRPCGCMAQKLMEAALMGTHLDERVSFEKFNLSLFSNEPINGRSESQRAHMEKLRRAGERYCERFPDNPKPNIMLTGLPGLGKSFLLGCIVRRLIERGHNAILITAYALQDIVLRERIQNQNTLALAPYINVELLAIDDLGGEPRINNVSSESFFSLINERTRANRATLVATNIASSELQDRYGERITSRLLDKSTTSVFWLRGRDLRQG